MVLKRVITKRAGVLQNRVHRQRVAIGLWMRNTLDGGERKSLGHFCRRLHVSSKGIAQVLRDPHIMQELDATVNSAAFIGVKAAVGEMVNRLDESSEEMGSRELVLISDHLAKVAHGAYKPKENEGSQIAVQIVLPPGLSRDGEEVREIMVDSQKTFGTDLA